VDTLATVVSDRIQSVTMVHRDIDRVVERQLALVLRAQQHTYRRDVPVVVVVQVQKRWVLADSRVVVVQMLDKRSVQVGDSCAAFVLDRVMVR
jgi:hypothetical protein